MSAKSRFVFKQEITQTYRHLIVFVSIKILHLTPDEWMIFTILGKNNESIGQSLFHTNKPYQINMFLSYIFMVEFMNSDNLADFVI